MPYTMGGAELLRKQAQTISGEKDLQAIYLPLETTIRVLLRVPESISSGKAGQTLDAAMFEEPIRQACAEALVGTEAQGFVVDVAAVLEFEPGED